MDNRIIPLFVIFSVIAFIVGIIVVAMMVQKYNEPTNNSIVNV